MIKLTFVLLITALLQISSAASFSQTVSLKFRNAKLEIVLKEIGTQTGYDLVYITPLINEAKPVSINVNNLFQISPLLILSVTIRLLFSKSRFLHCQKL
jgi:hypothetical protein